MVVVETRQTTYQQAEDEHREKKNIYAEDVDIMILCFGSCEASTLKDQTIICRFHSCAGSFVAHTYHPSAGAAPPVNIVVGV